MFVSVCVRVWQEGGRWIEGGQGMCLSSQCGRDDTGLTSQVPLTNVGEDGMGGDGGGSVWLGEADSDVQLCDFSEQRLPTLHNDTRGTSAKRK